MDRFQPTNMETLILMLPPERMAWLRKHDPAHGDNPARAAQLALAIVHRATEFIDAAADVGEELADGFEHWRDPAGTTQLANDCGDLFDPHI